MKYLLLVALLNLAPGLLAIARAEHCKIEGHEQELADRYEQVTRQLLTTLPKRAGFAADPATLEIKSRVVTDFLLDDNYAQPTLELSGSFRSTTGTGFTFTTKTEDFYTSNENEQIHVLTNEGEILFSTKLLSNGSDRQGNPRSPRCRLTTTNSWLKVTNERWKRTMVKFDLPSTFTISLEEK